MSAELTNVVCELDDLDSGSARKFDVAGVAVAVVRIGSEVFAIDDICSHAHVSLSDGEVWCDERLLECPKHGSVFSLETGVPQTLPATHPVRVHSASIVDDHIVVTIKGAP